jgi:predicted DNA-binding protein (MmcQ/YjbR family)
LLRQAVRALTREGLMKLDEFNAFCGSLPHTTHVVQWGTANVWKVGGKMFVIGWDEGMSLLITFKASEIAFDMLRDQPGLRPAPYLASRGLKWIQRTAKTSMSDKALKDYVRESYRMVAQGLPKKTQLSLGFTNAIPPSKTKSPSSPQRRSKLRGTP